MLQQHSNTVGEILMDTVGKRIKRIRKIRGWTQKELAERAGINLFSLKSHELDNKIPKYEQLLKLANALEIDVAFLQPVKLDTNNAIAALLFNLMEQYGDIKMEMKGGTVLFGIDCYDHFTENEKLSEMMKAHENLSPNEFMEWLTDYPPLMHNGQLIKRGKK